MHVIHTVSWRLAYNLRGLVHYHYGGKPGSRQVQYGALAKSLHPGHEFQGK